MLNVNKNFGFTKATGDWILSLDADERITSELSLEIKKAIELSSPAERDPASQDNSAIEGFWIARKNIIFGKWIQSEMWWPDYQLRLFRKNHGRFAEKHVHEKIEVKGETEKFKEPMLHYNYETVSQFIQKMDRIYTESEVENILKSKKTFVWVDAIRMPGEDFVKTYFAQKGYKDGLHGLVLSILQALYMEVVFAKVWERQGCKEQEVDLASIKKEGQKFQREFRYWFFTSRMEEADLLMKFALRVKRKLLS
jgi:glycosyltransferase involved in cell wall biosynthesis